MNSSYWGKPDTTVNFCEAKYATVDWIAEYYNTMSAISYIIVGFLFFFTRIRRLAISVILVGLSTIVMHGTLRYYGQWLDEGSMLLLCFDVLRFLDTNISQWILFPILFIYILLNQYYICFVSLFLCLQLAIIYKAHNLPNLDRLRYYFISYYSIFFSIALIFWLMDQLLCTYIGDLYLHALWHVFTALGILFGFTGLII